MTDNIILENNGKHSSKTKYKILSIISCSYSLIAINHILESHNFTVHTYNSSLRKKELLNLNGIFIKLEGILSVQVTELKQLVKMLDNLPLDTSIIIMTHLSPYCITALLELVKLPTFRLNRMVVIPSNLSVSYFERTLPMYFNNQSSLPSLQQLQVKLTGRSISAFKAIIENTSIESQAIEWKSSFKTIHSHRHILCRKLNIKSIHSFLCGR
ncbi:hypothetical protein MME56_004558 [Escherichia coli]|nr:hypothetical protein [Escherichia coli]